MTEDQFKKWYRNIDINEDYTIDFNPILNELFGITTFTAIDDLIIRYRKSGESIRELIKGLDLFCYHVSRNINNEIIDISINQCEILTEVDKFKEKFNRLTRDDCEYLRFRYSNYIPLYIKFLEQILSLGKLENIKIKLELKPYYNEVLLERIEALKQGKFSFTTRYWSKLVAEKTFSKNESSMTAETTNKSITKTKILEYFDVKESFQNTSDYHEFVEILEIFFNGCEPQLPHKSFRLNLGNESKVAQYLNYVYKRFSTSKPKLKKDNTYLSIVRMIKELEEPDNNKLVKKMQKTESITPK